MSSLPDAEDDPREELARIARALAATTRRLKAKGARRTKAPERRARPAAQAPARATPAVEVPRAQALPPLRAEIEGRFAVEPRPDSPRAAPVPRATLPPGPAKPALPDRGSIAERAAKNRARAAACKTLEELRAAVAGCTACGLCTTRTQTVFQDGRGTRRILFVGEAPGADEDRTGVPFVGRAGQLLTDIITKGMGLARDEVWIANVVKCRPPENRDPTGEEKELCTPWFDRQLELMDPALLIPLGRHASMHLLGGEETMGAMRGKVHQRGGRPIVPTYHPAYLLRSPGEKNECWKDIRRAMDVLGLPMPRRGPA